jgi:hypothetical protein
MVENHLQIKLFVVGNCVFLIRPGKKIISSSEFRFDGAEDNDALEFRVVLRRVFMRMDPTAY